MRKVLDAPKCKHLLEKYSQYPDVWPNLLKLLIQKPQNYDHWDKVRYKKPPNGFNREQWWLAIKLNRMSARRMLPLFDKNDNPFNYVLTDEILRNLHVIDSKANGFIGAGSNTLSEDAKNRYMISSLIEEAISSSQFEGASTTRTVASDMLRSGRRPRDKDERMIFNNYLAIKQIQKHQSEPLTIERLLNLHKTLTENTLDNADSAGRIQTPDEERIHVGDGHRKVFHRPPPAEQLPQRLRSLIKFANESIENGDQFIHPVLRAIVMHFIIGYDHPFVDGNGRIARAIFYHSVLRSGYDILAFTSISQIIKEAPARYGYAFQYVETDENDLTYFMHHQLDVICRAIDQLEKNVEKRQNEILRIKTKLLGMPLNYRQLALLSHALRHPNHTYTIRSHRTSHDCAYATARSDLMKLETSQLLKRKQLDQKTFGFVVPHNLELQIDSIGNT